MPPRPKTRARKRLKPSSTRAKSVQNSPLANGDKLKVALLGFGTVGRSVAKLISADPLAPFVLTHILNRNLATKRAAHPVASELPAQVHWTERFADVLASDADVVVELIGGLQPARDWIRKALRAGKSVVTANKLVIADHGPELTALAREMGRQLEFGAAVAGGIPAIIAIQEGLAGDRLRKIAGILNGTCNYILTQMESHGAGFDTALQEAQKLGYAEADPTSDIQGYDARAKLVILAQAGLRLNVRAEQISTWPISLVEAIDFLYAREINCTIRQISLAQKETSGDSTDLLAAVRPTLVPLTSLLAHVQGSQNLVIATGEFAGQIALSGYGAGGDPTAVAVVSDLYAIARKARAGTSKGPLYPEPAAQNPRKVSAEFTLPHYLRFVVSDRPGIIAEIAAVLSRYGVGIDAVVQKPGYPRGALPFIITLEACSSAVLDHALAEIARLDFHVQPPLCLPILAQ